MSSATTVLNSEYVIQELEPILVSYYKTEIGKFPTLYELKQYLVTQATENLVEIIKSSDSSTLKSMSAKEILLVVNLYIRKLRVW